MASTQSKFSERKTRSDRCANPFGIEGHKGQDLRNMSKKMLEKFSNFNTNSKICKQCRNMFYDNDKSSSIATEDTTDLDISEVNNSVLDINLDSSP